MSRATHRLREAALTLGAIGGALCFAAGIAAVAFGVTPLVVESGSMSPTIRTGALAISRDTPAESLRVGDVVRVKTGPQTSVTHRIIKITHRPGSATLRLKGDANKVPDAQIYTVRSAGIIVFSIPFAGRVVAAASGPIGLFLLGGYVAFVVMILIDERRKKGGGSGGARKATLTATAFLIGGLVVAEAAPEPTFAAWTDGVGVGTSTLSTYSVPKPVWVSCNVTGGALSQKTATIVWNEVSSPFALDYTATIQETGASMTVTDNGSTRQTQFSAGLLSTVLNQSYHVVIQAKLPSPNGSWVSSTMTEQVTITLLGLGMTCDSHD
jgi:signal peptidase I